MRRRTFIAGLGSTAAWPIVARAQQPPVPVIGLLSGGFPNPNAPFVVAFRQGLAEAGYVEGRNVAIAGPARPGGQLMSREEHCGHSPRNWPTVQWTPFLRAPL